MKAASFDYIVVGAGSAGCVLAHRLSADRRTTVLLLEAGGPDRRREIHIPAAFSKLFRTACDWAYETEPQKHLGGRTLYWPRGKMLGGSSSMNAMLYVRGNSRDYDGWQEQGCKGWSFPDVLRYFKRAEHQERGPSDYHGVRGPLNVADLRAANPLSWTFLEAAAELGLPDNDDFNGPRQEGVGFYQVTQKRGRRHSTATAYLRPARRRSNLTVLTGAHTTRVLFDGRCAIGVEYVADGGLARARAEREVILAAGAIASPQLLMLSGIGPPARLTQLGIDVVVELPGVGENLQDHPAVCVAYECRRPVTLASAERLVNVLRFLAFRSGPLTSCIAEAGGFLKTQPRAVDPDLQLLFAPAYFLEHGFLNPAGHGFSIGASAIRPESRGRLTLRSSDPMAPPVIQPEYLAREGDLRVLMEGVKLARRLALSRAFGEVCGAEVWPGRSVRSEASLAEFVRARVQTLYHPVGTCRMGADPAAVVDDHLRVRGVAGLRVVDASIMPTIVSGNTNAPTIMIAEKGADLIRAS